MEGEYQLAEVQEHLIRIILYISTQDCVYELIYIAL